MTISELYDNNKNNSRADNSVDSNTQALSVHAIQSLLSSANAISSPIGTISISQEYKQLVPNMLPNELQALEESVKKHGLYYPIIVNKVRVVLDGHHRYEICLRNRIEPRIEVRSFSDQLHEKLFICESASKRRNLNEWQKVELAMATGKLLKEIARQNSLANLKQNQIRTGKKISSRSNELVGDVAKAVAKSSGISATKYKQAKAIFERGTKKQIQRLKLGKSKISKEYNIIRRQEKKEQLIKEAQSCKLPFPDQINLICGDFTIVSSQIPDNSVDLILTDPPYDEASLPLYKELALLAGRKLKPGGSIVSYYGDRLLHKFRDYLENDAGLSENCTLHIKLQGEFDRDFEKGIVRKQKPMVWYYKGQQRQKTGQLLEDLIESEKPDKELHIWAAKSHRIV